MTLIPRVIVAVSIDLFTPLRGRADISLFKIEYGIPKLKTRKALIFGITGQDGSYLAELLIAKGYDVHGIIRRASSFNTGRIEHLYADPHKENRKLFLHYGDLLDGSRLSNLIAEIRPDEIYNLAAQSHVRVSFEEPVYTGDATALGTTRILEALLQAGHNSKFYQASSSEMFGAEHPPQSEGTKFYPRSPYGVAKLYAHWITVNYREARDMFAVSGILFNHESPRRGETFVTRKITRAVARIAEGIDNEVYLGNLKAKRDWGYAPDYVVAMWRMLQQDKPQDYVIGTGVSVSVLDFAKEAFGYAGLDYENHIRFDERYTRPTEVDHLSADSSKAQKELGISELVEVKQLAATMVEEDLKRVKEPGHVDKPIGSLWKQETRR